MIKLAPYYRLLASIMVAVFALTGSLNGQVLKFDHITVEEGLSVNTVQTIYQDREGFIWIGTKDGLNRFDGLHFDVFRHGQDEARFISDNDIRVLMEDKQGQLWVGTANGLNLFDRNLEQFESFDIGMVLSLWEDSEGNIWAGTDHGLYIGKPGTSFAYYQNGIKGDAMGVFDIHQSADGRIWLATDYGLFLFNQTHHSFKAIPNPDLVGEYLQYDNIIRILERPDGKFCLGTERGLGVYDPQTGDYSTSILNPEQKVQLMANSIISMADDQEGRLWIGTLGGLYLYENNTFQLFTHDPGDRYSLNDNAVKTIFIDRKGDVWVGTYFGGVNVYRKRNNAFRHYMPSIVPNSLNGKAVSAMLEMEDGTIWVGTEDAGLNKFQPDTETFQLYQQPFFPNAINRNNIQALLATKDDNLWVGTYGGGLNYFNVNSGSFQRVQVSDLYTTNNNILALYRDRNDLIWIGTDEGGLVRFDEKQRSFVHYLHDETDPNSLSQNAVISLLEDHQGRFWVGTYLGGLNLMDREAGTFQRFLHQAKDSTSISSDQILCLFEDSQQRLWIGTKGGGLNYMYEPGKFQRFSLEEGLPDPTVYGILEDTEGFFWLSTNKGLCRFMPFQNNIRTFSVADGLQSNQFNYRSYLKTEDGTMYFGGINGLSRFKPETIVSDTFEPQIVLTAFTLFNKTVLPQESGSSLQQHINTTKEIVLEPGQNVFGFGFVALDFTRPVRNQYAFKMEGFDNDWNYVGNQRSATFTNLDPGTYTFRVKGSNHDGHWSKQEKSIQIVILPPFWQTTWAYLLYFSFLAGLIYLVVSRLRLQNHLRFERLMREQEEVLSKAKVRFFTNISHELRTPLTMILSPLQRLMDTEQMSGQTQKQLQAIHRNANRLLRLINQLMDFSKAESGNMKLELAHSDLIQSVRLITQPFEDFARQKGIQFETHYAEERLYMAFDYEKLDKILYNLLSNAFKYTVPNGTVRLSLAANEAKNTVDIAISDTGIGIPAEQQAHIFDRFYQVKDGGKEGIEGTGIGLALTKELVRLHEGEITLQSTEGEGSVFTVRLPRDLQASFVEDYTEEKKVVDNKALATPLTQSNGQEKALILVVEDHLEMRAFLRQCLQGEYRVAEASNGKEGLALAQTESPDLVISDVMMPEVNGLEFCRQLKANVATSHIPVVLLTAKAEPAQQLEGLQQGADDYLIKPFQPQLLIARVRNLIRSRHNLRAVFGQDPFVSPVQLASSTTDEKFLNRVMEIVLAQLQDPSFNVKRLAEEVGMSHSVLYRKIKSLTGQTAKEFIITLRLKEAAKLLRSGGMNISEVAYSVGFNDPKHFSNSFRKQFGERPSKYK